MAGRTFAPQLAAGALLLLGVCGLAGLFHGSVLLDLIHLSSGVVGLVLARTPAGARAFLAGGSVAYLALWVVGVAGAGSFIPVHADDNWLHLLVGLGLPMLGRLPARELRFG